MESRRMERDIMVGLIFRSPLYYRMCIAPDQTIIFRPEERGYSYIELGKEVPIHSRLKTGDWKII